MVNRVRRARMAALTVAALLVVSGWGAAQERARGARVMEHDQSRQVERCAACHAADDPRRTANATRGGCDQQCISCHAADTTGHHPIGALVPNLREPALQRSSRGRIACRTCHDLERTPSDTVSWRAQSLFDAVFRRQDRYPTYHLAMRNQRGQLCQTCH
jgi:hypothetical protein